MASLNEVEIINEETMNEMEVSQDLRASSEKKAEALLENLEGSRHTLETSAAQSDNISERLQKVSTFEKNDNSSVFVHTLQETLNSSKSCLEREEKFNNKEPIKADVTDVSEPSSNKITHINKLPNIENSSNAVASFNEVKAKSSEPIVFKKVTSLVEAYTDSSQSSSSEPQSSNPPFESAWSEDNNINPKRVDFENAIKSETVWGENRNPLQASSLDLKAEFEAIEPQLKEEKTSPPEIPVITIDENTQPSAPIKEETQTEDTIPNFPLTGFPLPPPIDQPETTDSETDIKVEAVEQQALPEPVHVPVIPPAPRKRGRPRKQVLPNPSPLVESWGSNAQEFPTLETPKEERKRSVRAERRQYKKKNLEEPEADENLTRKRKAAPPPPKKKKRSTYVPKKKLPPPPKKKHSEIENIQNFEEETRMSASEGPTNFSSRSGAGDESQGSSATTEGPTRSNINKKGRMEVGTDGCKPVTVQQIVEYHWPPPSSVSHGEKTEGLMIQEQVCEYLGVKSFKRKYPSIKRRPVDMEERNYLQENGFVSENMCDMGLTAVFAADIIEIMYNDFPHKFDEYRKYTREKKAREQRALREKQAAERADMDPKKEAVESALSWNTEFNKTRRFRVLHINPNERYLSDGFPCPVSKPVVLMHAPDNSALCIEDEYWKMGLFSYECEVSSHTRINQIKQHLPQNIFVFVVGALKF